jgi:hypothetical protein
MTPAWKLRVRERLLELGKSPDWLDAELDVTRGMTRKMLGPKQNTSSLVNEVCRVLQIDPPVLHSDDPGDLEAVALLRRARPDQRAAVWAILELIKRETD